MDKYSTLLVDQLNHKLFHEIYFITPPFFTETPFPKNTFPSPPENLFIKSSLNIFEQFP